MANLAKAHQAAESEKLSACNGVIAENGGMANQLMAIGVMAKAK
jgi:hypothetical protein